MAKKQDDISRDSSKEFMQVNKEKFETLFRKFMKQPLTKLETLKSGEKKKAGTKIVPESKL